MKQMLSNQSWKMVDTGGKFVYTILFIICTCVVFWQLYVGTSKYISHPHGVRTFSQQLQLPQLTVCHHWGVLGYDVNPLGLQVEEYIDQGRFGEDNNEDVFTKATNQYYYLLDQTGTSRL